MDMKVSQAEQLRVFKLVHCLNLLGMPVTRTAREIGMNPTLLREALGGKRKVTSAALLKLERLLEEQAVRIFSGICQTALTDPVSTEAVKAIASHARRMADQFAEVAERAERAAWASASTAENPPAKVVVMNKKKTDA